MGHSLNDLIDLAFLVAVAGLVGARLGYFLEQPQEFSAIGDFFRLDRGGLSFFFGFAFAFPMYWLVLWRKKIPILDFSDGITTVLPASLAILKVGCFSSGCCYGTETHLPWAVAGIPASLGLHPVQLYESVFLVCVSVAVYFLWKKKKLPPGTLAAGFLFFYAGFRLLTAPIRGDLLVSNALGFPSVYLTGSLLLISSLAALIYFSARRAS